ncbi:uncharacterized protein LOC126368626 isoform X2 [Pectinophora gossypiella]|uniref:uncharacterized protein LOC126368626 isoform X2 n=1 Tax=Pectinophora gossypiella TaxID=13191 RepID=UPI00214E10BC|nr:uncharacterized protein LOC126368626 isoform X2 [Pectinophora gossypiella]
MFTVSCYTLHPIVAKILALWRWAQTVSDWLTFLLSMSCCQCWAGMPPPSISDNDSISCYKMLSSSHMEFIDVEELDQNAVDLLHSDEELDTTAHPMRNLHITDSTLSGPSIYIDQACGEPQGQQLVLDFAPTAADLEIELRNLVCDLESSHGSGSTNVTSDSEAGLSRAQRDHSRAQYRASHYAHGSDMEVEVKNHLPEYDGSIPVVNRCSESFTNGNQEETHGQTISGPSIYIDQACGEPRGQQLVLDFTPTAADLENELRTLVYDLDSSHGSGPTNVNSHSEAGLSRAQGDHTRAQYRASHYTHGSDMEVEVKNHLPEYDCSIPVVNRCSEPLANENQEGNYRQMSAPLISFQPPNVKSTVGSLRLQVSPEREVKSLTCEENLAFEGDVEAGLKESDQRSMKAPSVMKGLRNSDMDNHFPAVHNCTKISDKARSARP